MTPSAIPLTDAELDRLEELLDDPALEEALRLDEAQGYLCAALAGPRPMPPERWLSDILGSDEALEQPVGLEAAGLLRRFADALEADLNAGEPPTLLLYPLEEGDDAPTLADNARAESRMYPRPMLATSLSSKPYRWNAERIAQAWQASGLTRDDYAQAMHSKKNEQANAMLQAALEEAAAQMAKDEALLRAFEASAQSETDFAQMYGLHPREAARALARARQQRSRV